MWLDQALPEVPEIRLQAHADIDHNVVRTADRIAYTLASIKKHHGTWACENRYLDRIPPRVLVKGLPIRRGQPYNSASA